MARKQEEKIVKTSNGEMPILVTQMDGVTGSEMSIELAQLFGPHIVAAVMAMNDDRKEEAAKQVGEFLQKLSPAKFSAIRRALLKGARANTGDGFVDVDEDFISGHFAGRAGSLFGLVAFALKLNFANFFEDLGLQGSLAKLGSKVKTAMALEASPNP